MALCCPNFPGRFWSRYYSKNECTETNKVYIFLYFENWHSAVPTKIGHTFIELSIFKFKFTIRSKIHSSYKILQKELIAKRLREHFVSSYNVAFCKKKLHWLYGFYLSRKAFCVAKLHNWVKSFLEKKPILFLKKTCGEGEGAESCGTIVNI